MMFMGGGIQLIKTIKKIKYANETCKNTKENIKTQKCGFEEEWNKWGKKSMSSRNIP